MKPDDKPLYYPPKCVPKPKRDFGLIILFLIPAVIYAIAQLLVEALE